MSRRFTTPCPPWAIGLDLVQLGEPVHRKQLAAPVVDRPGVHRDVDEPAQLGEIVGRAQPVDEIIAGAEGLDQVPGVGELQGA
ncbi:MAG: hypothetical protein ACRDRH_05470 [Pseudonocardia sp.]